QEQRVAAYRNRRDELLEGLLEAEDVALGRSNRAIERAEVAARDAHVRVIDVPVDDVGDDALGVLPGANRIGELAEQVCRRVAIELERLGAIDASAVQNLPGSFVQHHFRRVRKAVAIDTFRDPAYVPLRYVGRVPRRDRFHHVADPPKRIPVFGGAAPTRGPRRSRGTTAAPSPRLGRDRNAYYPLGMRGPAARRRRWPSHIRRRSPDTTRRLRPAPPGA